MMDMLMFAVIFTSVQLVMGFIATFVAMKYFMSKRYLKKATKTIMEATQELQEDLLEDF